MHGVEPMSAMNGKKKRSRTSIKGQGGDIVPPLPDERAAALKAALDKPISKLDAARCIVHVFNTVFGPVVAKQITGEVSTTLNVPQLDLKAWLPKPREKVQVQRRNKPRTPYMLFLSYAISELYKHKDLPVLKRFLDKHGDHGRIDMQAANQLWKTLPDVDKARLTAWLGPFLNSFNGETKQRFEQRLQEGDTEKHPSGGELRDRYVQYVEAHPEASLIRLLRLDGNTEDLTPPDNLLGAVRTGNKAAGGATVAGPSTGGPSAMDVDEEVEEEREEEEYQDADEEEGEADVDADDTDVVVDFPLPEAAGGSAHRSSDKSESESESESSTTSSSSSESSEVESEEEKQAAPGPSSAVRPAGARDEEANETGGDNSSSSESSGTSESSTSSESEKGGDGRMSQEEEDTSSSD